MESIQVFGAQENLVGVYRAAPHTTPAHPAVLMLTAGMLHHVGPMRLHVQLARQLAAQGTASFRFDLSGIGESLAVAASGNSLDRAGDEIIEAMNWLQSQQGHTEFALFGLCSGADDALAAALRDSRIVALTLLDGCGYPTPASRGHRFRRKILPKLLSPRKWRDYFLSALDASDAATATMPLGEDIREFPDRATAEQQIQRLLARGVRLQFIYTGGVVDYYSYAEQFFDMFPNIQPDENLSVEYCPTLDHLAALAEDRQLILDRACHWLASPLLPVS